MEVQPLGTEVEGSNFPHQDRQGWGNDSLRKFTSKPLLQPRLKEAQRVLSSCVASNFHLEATARMVEHGQGQRRVHQALPWLTLGSVNSPLQEGLLPQNGDLYHLVTLGWQFSLYSHPTPDYWDFCLTKQQSSKFPLTIFLSGP